LLIRINVTITASDIGSLSRWRERVRVRGGKLEQAREKRSWLALTPTLSQREREYEKYAEGP
jgi:type IV secretory pathway TrbF-like protein